MHERVLAKRYGAALFQMAQKMDAVDAVEADLRQIDALTETAPKLLYSLEQPVLPDEEKSRIIDRAFGDRVAPMTSMFLKLLIAKRRANLLPLIFEAFESFAEELRNEARLQVMSAVPLSEPERAELIEALSARTGKRLKPVFEVDPALIAGVWARVGDTVYDGSVVSKLRRLAEKLTFARL